MKFPANADYVPRHVVDRYGDSLVESFVVHSPYIDDMVEPGLKGEENYVSNSP
jgi:hypothetical protein